MTPAPQRVRVIYHGRVQGVGFRATAQHIATEFAISGYVRNRDDGSVELEAQGEAAEVQRFLDALAARFARHIRSADIQPADTRSDGRHFEIRHG